MEHIDNHGLSAGKISLDLSPSKSKGKEEFKYVVVNYEKTHKQFLFRGK